MTIAAICVLVVWCFWWIIRDDLATRSAHAWDQHIESIVTDTDLYPDHPDAATRIGEGA